MLLWTLLLVCHSIFVGKIFLFNFSGSIPPLFFVLLSLFFFCFEIIQKRKNIIALGFTVFIIFLGLTQSDFVFPWNTNKETVINEEYNKTKVFSWNTNCWDQYKDEDQFYIFLKKQNADIYLLQEYLYAREWNETTIDQDKFFAIYSHDPFFPENYVEIDDIAKIRETFPGYYIAINKQFVTISRYPILSSYCDPSEQYAVTDIILDTNLVRFFNVHILLHIEPENPFTFYFYNALFNRFTARKRALMNLKQAIKDSKSDYFIAGDFNSTKAMGIFNSLLTNNIDAACYANDIIPLTFEYWGLKLWRMDYILIGKTNSNVKVIDFHSREHEGLSDHDPLYMTLGNSPQPDGMNFSGNYE
jgi:endonuclease/exonuclease/phosphatase family metal-dependent hydrolase